jgi:hypothetical protein
MAAQKPLASDHRSHCICLHRIYGFIFKALHYDAVHR